MRLPWGEAVRTVIAISCVQSDHLWQGHGYQTVPSSCMWTNVKLSMARQTFNQTPSIEKK